MKTCALWAFIICTVLLSEFPAWTQSFGNAGTIGAAVRLNNPVTGYRQSVISAGDGSFRLVNS
jgi:hypothetical protein